MARSKGTAIFAVNFEPTGQSCLDARLVVGLKSDLTAAATYADNNIYNGMVVAVLEDNTLWMLTDMTAVTSASSWKQLDGGSVGGDITELQTQITANADAITKLNGENTVEGSVAKSIKDAVEALDASDTAVAKSFVTSVSETDGKITVSRGAVASADKTVTLSDGSDGGIDLAVNIDGDTIVKDSSTGKLSVASAALVQYKGENAITVSDVDGDNNKTISLTVKDGDLFLTNDENGLSVTVTMSKLTDTEVAALSDSNVKEAYQLEDKSGKKVGDVIKIYKDSSLKSVVLNGQALDFTYILADGSESTVSVDISSFLAESEFSNGLQVVNHIVSVKVDTASESFLTVGADGVKLSGVQDAIDTAAAKATTKVTKTDSASHLTLESSTAADGSTTYTIGESDIASATDLTAEVTRAKTAEEANAAAITQEVADRKAAIEALDAELVGSDGSYIKTVTEADGVVTAVAQKFDTTLSEDSTDNNAPTSKAVYDVIVADEKVTSEAFNKVKTTLGISGSELAYEALTTDTIIGDATSYMDADTKLAAAIKSATDAARSIKAGNGISVTANGTVDTVAAVAVSDDPIIEVTANGIGTKEDAVFDCGTY